MQNNPRRKQHFLFKTGKSGCPTYKKGKEKRWGEDTDYGIECDRLWAPDSLRIGKRCCLYAPPPHLPSNV